VFLRIRPGMFDPVLSLLDRLLSTTWRDWLESRRPEFSLPPRVVMKREKLGWSEEYDNEKSIHRLLTPIQGAVVPRLYGEVMCPPTRRAGTRALIISDVGGVPLCRSPGLDVQQLEAMLCQAFQALAVLKVDHEDYKMDNYHVVGDKIMVIDFDTATTMNRPDDYLARSDARRICRLYEQVDWDWELR
jgi:hypothetical protein